MLPPATMLQNKKLASTCVALACVGLFTGCAPSGTKLVREAKQLLAQGKYTECIQKLNLAATLLPTNAIVWNELGLALHYAGNISNAVDAYRKALSLNRDLAEARYNLGCLLFEQGKLDQARLELIAFTLQRPTAVEGWLKLGSVQLRLRDSAGAEKSFREALKLDANNPAALNGLGLALLQKNRPKDAAEIFYAALDADPAFAPAVLNLAIVAHTYLTNRLLAIEKYRQYAALEPRQPDAQVVLSIAEQLERELVASPRTAAAEPTVQPPTNTAVGQKLQQTATSAVATVPTLKLDQGTEVAKPDQLPKTIVAIASPSRPPEPTTVPAQQTAPEPLLHTTTSLAIPSTPSRSISTVSSKPTIAQPPQPQKPSLLDRLNPLNWFRGEQKPRPTPLPPTPTTAQHSPPIAQQSSPTEQPGPVLQPTSHTGTVPAQPKLQVVATQPNTDVSILPQIPRYVYGRIAKPVAGATQLARVSLAKGVEAHRARRLNEALEAYKQAVQADPSCFEAQYNLGVAAHELKLYPTALAAYETALAIEPNSTLARYNFALALRDAGYLLDAAAELEKVITADPTDTRAHLALANLYAQRLGNRTRARVHYLRVLELDPGHPQATAIRYWLSANPG